MNAAKIRKDPSLEAETRLNEIKQSLEKYADGIEGVSKFQSAKANWAKLEKAFDDRINKLNEFGSSADGKLKKAEEKLNELQKSLSKL